MLQFPTATRIIPTSHLLTPQWPKPHSEELLLAIEESELEEKYNDIRKINNNHIVIGKTTVENDKEDFDDEADDDDADNAEESEGDEFEQETVENDKEDFDDEADDDDADNAEESEGDEFEQETS